MVDFMTRLGQDIDVQHKSKIICIGTNGMLEYLYTYMELDDPVLPPLPCTLGSIPTRLVDLRGCPNTDAPFKEPMSLSTSRSI